RGKLVGRHVITSNATPRRLICWFDSKGSIPIRLTTDRLLPALSAGCCAVPSVRCCAKLLTARVCTHKIAIGDSDLINVRFGPLCGLKSDISQSAKSSHLLAQCAKCVLWQRSHNRIFLSFAFLAGCGVAMALTDRRINGIVLLEETGNFRFTLRRLDWRHPIC